MNRNSKIRFIIGIFILLLFFLLVLLILLLKAVEVQDTSGTISVVVEEEKPTPKTVIEKYGNVYLEEEENTIYVEFKKDLFNDNGSSNEEEFLDLVDALTPFYETRKFVLKDNQKGITISAEYDYKEKGYKVTFNGVDDFFNKVDGKAYIAVNNVEITRKALMYVEDDYLNILSMNSNYFSSISKYLKEGVERNNNYTDYKNGTMSVRLAPNKAVKNIVFRDGYSDKLITTDIDLNTPLRDIIEWYPNVSFGSLSQGYLGYRIDEWYLFFYNDEISVYAYSYNYNTEFEKMLEKYLSSDDLDSFIYDLRTSWRNYDSYKYDPETGEVYLLYASRGIEINSNGNSDSIVTLYSNYRFTNRTKKYVKQGKVKINSEDDLIDTIERKRRDNSLVLY